MGIEEFDVFVIGTGTAGKGVAKDCAEAGWKVAIADNREYGGTCPNRGCDPKKVLVGITEIIERSQNLMGLGISKMPEVSWEDLQKFKYKFTGAIPAATEKDLAALDIKMYHQSPKFLDKNTLSVEGKTVKAKKIVIATGNKPMPLPIPGKELLLTSDDFLDLEKLPTSMIFIGAGYIGMEFAHIAARLGVEVTMIDTQPRPLSNFDEDMVAHLTEASEAIGIKFIFNAKASKVEKLRKYTEVTAELKNGDKVSAKAELVFNTAGRVPSIDELDLEKGNVAYTNKGITVNEHLQNSTNKDVYACGDVSNSEGLPLTPLSSQESRVVSTNLLGKYNKTEAHYPPQPSVVFTLPNVASVGLSEQQVNEQGLDYVIKYKSVPSWFNSKRIANQHYAFKVIKDKKTEKILGAHLVGPDAGEMINMFVMAMGGDLSCQDLKSMIFAYPTWSNDIKGMT
ncbi:dihydrolipoyl dehydrogenase family protein [Mesonia aestuariivivens]|uniref:NAD(P)/FAD-dependent oxidoreductase n=1 Tax=Mesonia aestuariivivens TaxID=2796128 RepID=A0ABS6VXK6_9FLAO|nr:NAD(P)/FAD-dependent oxidoreductase [Mesonia aestuariivivens]MBW2960312.1 NAD(P)/FAD-dependent oxidoreductase [Mesonia aestuariivivens]